MADITGIINGTTSNSKIDSRIVWEETVDIAGNKGAVKATLQLRTRTGYETTSGGADASITINGNKLTWDDFSRTIGAGTAWVDIIWHTVANIAHNDDGTKSITISASGKMAGTSVSSISCSGTAVLYAIPRASAITSHTTSVDVNGTNKITVNISRKLAAYTHRVRYYIGADYATATYKAEQTGVATSTEYAIPTAWRLSMPTATSITAKVEVTTFNGATQIGSSVTASFALTVPASVKPTINATNVTLAPKQPTAISGFTNYVQGYSECEATFKPNASDFGSEVAISEKYVTYGSLKDNVTPYLTGVLNTAGTITLTVGVKDARGRTATQTRTITVQAYSKPTANGFSVFRCDNLGAASDVGGYISVKATRIFSSVGGNNSVTAFRARYKATTAGSYGSWTNLTSGVVSLVGGGTLLTTQSYDVQVQITDAVGNTSSYNFKVPTAATAFNLKDGGRGVAFGKYAETEELAEFDYPIKAPSANFTGAITVGNPGQTLMNLGIRRGYTGVNSVDATSYLDVDVTFGTPFASGVTPTVIVTLRASGTTLSVWVETQYAIHTITNTGFKIRFWNNSASALSVDFGYIAIN